MRVPEEPRGLKELERRLRLLGNCLTGDCEADERSEQVRVNRRVRGELHRYFGADTVGRLQSESRSGRDTLLRAADRLFVAFLGRRAATAIAPRLLADAAPSAQPTAIRWLWTILAAHLVVGAVAYGHFVWTGSYAWLSGYFLSFGAAFLFAMASAEVWFSSRARRQFDFNEPMHAVWTLILAAAVCRLGGTILGHGLEALNAWDHSAVLRLLGSLDPARLHNLGFALGSPVAMTFLATGLLWALRVKRRSGVIGGLSWGDRGLIALILAFTIRHLLDIGHLLFVSHVRPDLTRAVMWLSDPLLALLLVQAVLLRRSVLNMGDGLVARCWGMMAAGVALTSAGDLAMWAVARELIPQTLVPLTWYIWFLAPTAYASAACYQVQAVRLAQRGTAGIHCRDVEHAETRF